MLFGAVHANHENETGLCMRHADEREREVGETARTGRFSFEVRREKARACNKFRAEAGESARMQPLARSIEHAGAGVIASGVERAEN